jgi:hypothetical protein
LASLNSNIAEQIGRPFLLTETSYVIHPSSPIAFRPLPDVEFHEPLADSRHLLFGDEWKRLKELCVPFYSCPSGTTPTTTSTTHTHAFTSSKRSSKTSVTHNRGKGKRQQPSDSESDEEEVEPPRKSSRKQMGDTAGLNRRYACPWFKRYPRKHFACAKCSFAKMSHVTQHLQRAHVVSTFYCAVCGVIFETSTDRDVHLRARSCEKRDFELDNIPADKWDEIHAKSKGKSRTNDQKWCDVYTILFGDASPVPSPWYIDGYEAVARLFERFISNSTNLPRILNTVGTTQEAGHLITPNGPNTELIDAVRNTLSQIFDDHLASEQEPPGPLLPMPSLCVPNTASSEPAAQSLVWSLHEDASSTSFQIHRSAVSMPATATPQNHESYVNFLSQPQEIPGSSDELAQQDVEAGQELYSNMQPGESPSAFLDFLGYGEDSLSS